jgi:hypothetical protein
MTFASFTRARARDTRERWQDELIRIPRGIGHSSDNITYLADREIPTLIFDDGVQSEPVHRCICSARDIILRQQERIAFGCVVHEVGPLKGVPECSIVVETEGVKVGS